jgi:lipopolysaccharide/colanic/teichoic acid biosynthesis glycosyltransferase
LTDSFYTRYGKRCCDAAASLLGLFLLFPVFLLIAVAIALDSPGSPFFLQNRAGRREKVFRIIKFRTMRVASENSGALITAHGDARVTRVGRFLRKAKVDELPQLINVLRGEMSLVGPRPEVPKYTRLYSPEQQYVFTVRPGITGPAAIAFTKEEELLSRQNDPEDYYIGVLLQEKLAIDLDYCRNVTLREDAALVLATFSRLLGRRSTVVEGTEAPSSKSVPESS